MLKDNKTLGILVNTTLVLLIILLITRISFILKPVVEIGRILLLPFVISIFLYYAIKPLLGLMKGVKINKSLKIIIVLLGIVLVLSVMFTYGGAVIKNQLGNFLSANSQIISNPTNYINEKLGPLLPNLELSQNIISSVGQFLKKLAEGMGSVVGQLGNFGTQVILVPFILFYFLRDDDSFTRSFVNIIPSRYKEVTRDTLKQIDDVLSTYISGQMLVALVIGILMYIGYLIIGMPNAVLMSFFSMVTAVIPFLGAFLGIIPAVLIALTIDVSLVIKILIVMIIVQQVEGNLITPNIVGNKLKIHPLVVILIVIISVSLFGIIGAFVGIPLYVSLKVIIGAIGKVYSMNRFQVK